MHPSFDSSIAESFTPGLVHNVVSETTTVQNSIFVKKIAPQNEKIYQGRKKNQEIYPLT